MINGRLNLLGYWMLKSSERGWVMAFRLFVFALLAGLAGSVLPAAAESRSVSQARPLGETQPRDAIAVSDTAAVSLAAAPASDTKDNLRKMIGQMIVVGFQGDSVDSPWVRKVARQIADGRLGGVIYLKDNISGEGRVKAMNMAFAEAGGDEPPFIGVDQEGGEIQRLTAAVGFREIPSASRVARRMSPLGAYRLYSALATELHDWGFNLNFGPVADVNVNAANPIIGGRGRSFSKDPDIVAQYGAAFVRAHRDAGIATALKHFPGHGSSTADSHKEVADISDTWSASELAPFRQLINAGYADMVMVGHLYDRKLQKGEQKVPASLSKAVVRGLLRRKLGFNGIVVSDDLQMDAIEKNYSLEQAAVQAVEAGDDLLIFSNYKKPDADLPDRIIAALADRAARDPRLADSIVRSYARIRTFKMDMARDRILRADTTVTKSIAPARPSVTPGDVESQHRDVALTVLGLNG